MHVCTCVCVCREVRRLTHGGQRLTLGTFVFPSPPCILRQGLSLNLKLVNALDWQACVSPRGPSTSTSQCSDYKHTPPWLVLCVQRSEFGLLGLCNHFTNGEVSPASWLLKSSHVDFTYVTNCLLLGLVIEETTAS